MMIGDETLKSEIDSGEYTESIENCIMTKCICVALIESDIFIKILFSRFN